MAIGTISIRAVEALGPGDALWDAEHKSAVRGFGVRRQRDAATYVVKYRVAGRQRFLTIGPHGAPWTPEKARREAKRLLGLVAEGRDPADERAQAAQQAADTLGLLVDQYLGHAKQKQKPRTYVETERHLRVAWKPLHRQSIFSLSRRHIATRLGALAAERGPIAATHARAALSALFNWAIAEGYEIGANPVLGTNRPSAGKARDRVLTDAELRAIWLACDDDDYGRMVRLLMLTAQRRDEVGGMRWPELSDGTWTIPGARTKNHREHSLPLSGAALALIEAQPRRNDRDFVFGDGPRKSGDRHRGFSGWSKSKAALDARIAAKGEPLPHWTIHDLRRTSATVMADRLDVLPHIVEAILNHVSGHRAGVAGVYNRARYAGEMREALDRWAQEVLRIIEGRPRSITLRRVVVQRAEAASGG
jgi:integrase